MLFHSQGKNLAPPMDTNAKEDVFLYDRATGTTVRVSATAFGGTSTDDSYTTRRNGLSDDGRFAVFESHASNILPPDTNGQRDVFVRDLQLSQTVRASVSTTGGLADGRSQAASLSRDGRYALFDSNATNLVAGDTNGVNDAFLRDLQLGQTVRLSVDSAGNQGDGESHNAGMSGDGRYVVFDSKATNLVPGDTNGSSDVFVRDMLTGMVERVSVDATGLQGDGISSNAALSFDGRYVLFRSQATNLVSGGTNGMGHAFVKDRTTGDVTCVSVSSAGVQGNDITWAESFSDDGRFVCFTSEATNLVPGDTNAGPDLFVHDRLTGQTVRRSVSSTGQQLVGWLWAGDISADGSTVVFETYANNVVPGENNGLKDAFAHEWYDAPPATYCTAKTTSGGCVPKLVGAGVPSWSDGTGFALTTTQMESGFLSLMFFSLGANALPFQGGFLCVAAPLHRMSIQGTGAGGPCGGTVAYTLLDLTQNVSGGSSVVPGAEIYCQTWGRDTAASFGSSLSDAVSFMVLP